MRLALIGCGLIGASAAWAMKKAQAVDEVVAYNRHPEAAQEACRLGFADSAASRIEDAVEGADAVLVAVPVLVMRSVFQSVARALSAEAVVSDVGSVRGPVVQFAREAFGDSVVRYCPVHPIAGGEKTGIEAADPALFCAKNAIVTPLPETALKTRQCWETLWQSTGARLAQMSVEQHDAIFAAVSHLPHLTSFALVDAILAMPQREASLKFAGPGFRDTTRIAAASPSLWEEICLANREALLSALEVYEERLTVLKNALKEADGEALRGVFERASHVRQSLNLRDKSLDEIKGKCQKNH